MKDWLTIIGAGLVALLTWLLFMVLAIVISLGPFAIVGYAAFLIVKQIWK